MRRTLFGVLVVCITACFGWFSWYAASKLGDGVPPPMFIVLVAISLVMSVVPVMICLAQTRTRLRQLDKLRTLAQEPVYNTAYCRVARTAINPGNDSIISLDYALPLATLMLVVTAASVLAACSLLYDDVFKYPVALLGGMRVVADNATTGDIKHYQEGTFIIGVVAFTGSYVSMLGRLLDRVGTNDLPPIALHQYSARLLVAVLSAAVFRHVAAAMDADKTELLVLLGFAAGLAPDLFIVSMSRRAFQALKVFGGKDDPDPALRPRSLPLLMLDDMTKEKVDRFMEIGIDSAQMLACQNPFTIWPKLPFDLGLLVDWIAAAQLYTLLDAAGLRAAHTHLLSDIFDLHLRLSCQEARKPLCTDLKITEAEGLAVMQQLNTDQSFTRLREVRDALLVLRPAVGP